MLQTQKIIFKATKQKVKLESTVKEPVDRLKNSMQWKGTDMKMIMEKRIDMKEKENLAYIKFVFLEKRTRRTHRSRQFL